MGIGHAIGKLGRSLALGGNLRSRVAMLALFCARYDYPGCAALRPLFRGVYRRRTLTLDLRARRPMRVTLRPSMRGDVASLFENLVEQEVSAGALGSPRRVVDAGAHIGCFSLWLRDEFPEAEITAFEPDAANFSLLRRNFALNRVRGEARRRAVWTATKTLSFAAGESNAGRIDENGGVRVEAESLADALGPRLAEVDLVKMDIEGAETAVLPGLLGRLRSTCRIIVEWHDAGRTRGVLRGALKAAGWTGNRLARVGPHELWLLGAPGVRTHHT